MILNALRYIWLFINLHGFKGWQVGWNGGDPFATDAVGEHLLRQKGTWVRYKMVDPEFRAPPIRSTHPTLWDALQSEYVGRAFVVLRPARQLRRKLVIATGTERLQTWWDRPAVLLSATLYGFVLLQALRAVKAYLGVM